MCCTNAYEISHLLPKFTTCVTEPMQQVWLSCQKLSWEFSSCFPVQCLFIDLPTVNLWIFPISLLDCTDMVCSLLQEKDNVHPVDTLLVWKRFPKSQWKWNAVYTSVADCSWTEHKMAAAWSLQQPVINFDGPAEGKSSSFYHQHFASAWWNTKNQDLINFINKRQEVSTRTISNLLQRHWERIPAVQSIAVTVT